MRNKTSVQNYIVIKITFDSFVTRILEFNLSDKEQIINYFESMGFDSNNIEKIRFLFEHEHSG